MQAPVSSRVGASARASATLPLTRSEPLPQHPHGVAQLTNRRAFLFQVGFQLLATIRRRDEIAPARTRHVTRPPLLVASLPRHAARGQSASSGRSSPPRPEPKIVATAALLCGGRGKGYAENHGPRGQRTLIQAPARRRDVRNLGLSDGTRFPRSRASVSGGRAAGRKPPKPRIDLA